MQMLQQLALAGCDSLTSLPDDFGQLGQLADAKILDLQWCGSLTRLPASIGNMQAMQELCLNFCRSLLELPAELGELKQLWVLKLDHCTALTSLSALCQLTTVTKLSLRSCRLAGLPSSMADMCALQHLHLGLQCMEEWPCELIIIIIMAVRAVEATAAARTVPQWQRPA
jgi:Leucine-rich repeat (LRR) protein